MESHGRPCAPGTARPGSCARASARSAGTGGGGLAMRMGSKTARASPSEHREAAPVVLASRCKSDFKNTKSPLADSSVTTPHPAAQQRALPLPRNSLSGLLKCGKVPRRWRKETLRVAAGKWL